MALFRSPRDRANTSRRKKTETADVTQREEDHRVAPIDEIRVGVSVERTGSMLLGTALLIRRHLSVIIYITVGTS